MIELKNKYSNKNAIVIFGGPSILENNYDLSALANKNDIIFLQSNALTPKFAEFGIEPNFFFMPYPEKIRTSSLQWLFIQAISCGYELKKDLKEEYIVEWLNFKNKFSEFAEIWRIEYPHKRYRIKSDIMLDNSPLSLIDKYPNMGLITYDLAYNADGILKMNLPNKVYKYSHSNDSKSNFNTYFNPDIKNGILSITNMGYVNSSAISLYPILKYMGFKKVSLIGMDMSMLGSMEFSAPYIFKTMHNYNNFFNACRKGFSYNFPGGLRKGILNFGSASFNDLRSLKVKKIFSSGKYLKFYNDVFGLSGRFMKESFQLTDTSEIFKSSGMEFINIYEDYQYAKRIPGIDNISFQKYINKL